MNLNHVSQNTKKDEVWVINHKLKLTEESELFFHQFGGKYHLNLITSLDEYYSLTNIYNSKEFQSHQIALIIDHQTVSGNFKEMILALGNKHLFSIVIADHNFHNPQSVPNESDSNLSSVVTNALLQGATDYVVKPLNFALLDAKIEYYFLQKKADFTKSKHQEFQRKIKETLTRKQQKLLSLFLSSKDLIISRQEILDCVWNGEAIHPKSVDVQLYNLRKQIAKFGHQIILHSPSRWKLMPQDQNNQFNSLEK